MGSCTLYLSRMRGASLLNIILLCFVFFLPQTNSFPRGGRGGGRGGRGGGFGGGRGRMIWLDGGYTTAGGYSGSGPKWRTLPSMWIYSTNSGGTKSWRWLPEFKYDVNSPTYRYGGIYRDEYYGVRLRGGGRGGRGGGRWTSKPESPLKKYEIKGWGKAVDSSKQAAMSSMKVELIFSSEVSSLK